MPVPEALWIERHDDIAALAPALETRATIGVDTEFLRERTYFPRLCVLQIATGEHIYCVDALHGAAALEPLGRALTAARVRKLIHSARQDLEAWYVTTGRLIAPVFDTQIAAACVGLKPQTGYAELVRTLLEVTLPKGQTRTDWSRRPLTPAQLAYAADDVRYLEAVADRLLERLERLGRTAWALEDCAALADARLYAPDPEQAWRRVKRTRALAPPVRARLRALAAWRERRALERDLPRGWVLSDDALIELAQRPPADRSALRAMPPLAELEAAGAAALLEVLTAPLELTAEDLAPPREAPSDAEKALIARLAATLEARAAELGVSPELLATRAELKALAAGERDLGALRGWRAAVIGEPLLAALG